MIAVLDYGVGNLKSVERMVAKAGVEVSLTADPAAIERADKLIIPGVGHFGYCAERLRESKAFGAIERFVTQLKRPVLGICVGAQLLGDESEEAPGVPGLGWIKMRCRRFSDQEGYRVPNMGWNSIAPRRNSPLLQDLNPESRFYFVHSYYLVPHDSDVVVATANYGFDYACVLQQENIFGVQFHPEKSLKHGMAVLKRFAEL